ncbi:MAG: hypothetical protein WD426_20005 [Anditalea sp.]
MNLRDKILGYFYAIVLAYLSIAIPNGDLSILKIQLPHPQVENSSEKVASIDLPDNLYLINKIANSFLGHFRVDHFPNADHFFSGYVFQYLYWKSYYTTVLSFLEAVNIKFKPADIIFPFHYFW